MPIYEYRCPDGHAFEVFKSMSEPAPERCETCGAAPLHQVLYPVAVHYKGSGFYATDYGRSKRKGGSSKDGSESSEKTSDGGGEEPAEKKAAEA